MMMNAVSSELDPLMAVRQQADAFAELADALGIPRDRLADKETLDSVKDVYPVPSSRAIDWDVSTITRCLQQLGTDAELILTTRGADPAFDPPEVQVYGHRVSVSDINAFIENLRTLNETQGNEVRVDVRLAVQKTRVQELLKRLQMQRADFLGSAEILAKTKAVIFFQSTAWHKLLTVKALWTWESRGLLSHGHRLVVALCDAEGYLGGTAVEVLGTKSDNQPPWLTLTHETWGEFLERSEDMRKLCIEESNWGISLQTVTPEYFELHEIVPGLGKVAESFDCMQAALSAAYMADSVQLDETKGQVVLRFAGTRPSHMLLPFNSNKPTIAGDFSQHTLFDLATWAFRHGSPDKLMIARECLARALPSKASTSLNIVEAQAGDALDASKSNFKTYLRGNTSQYFQMRQQAVDAVTAYAEGVEKTVSELSSDLVGNVYKVAGLLAGAIAAVLIQPAVTIQVLALAVGLQILYVLFIVLYALPAQERRYRTEKNALEKRLAVMTELGEKEREQIREAAGGADSDFDASYQKARCIYLWMCAACLVIGILAASIFASAHSVTHSAQSVPTPHATSAP